MKKHTLFICIFSVLFVILSGIYSLLYTAAGFAWYLNRNLGETGVSISIDKVIHTFNGNYVIHGLKYLTPDIRLAISKLDLDWNPLGILRQKIDIRSLSSEFVSLQLTDHGMRKTSESTVYQLPFVIQINQGSIKNLSVAIADTNEKLLHNVNFEHVDIYGNFFANNISFETVNGDVFEVSGKVGFRQNDVINLTTKSKFTLPNIGKMVSSQGTIVGRPAQLKFLQQIAEPVNSSVAGSITNLFVNPELDFLVKVHALSGDAIHPYFKLNLLQGELTGNGSLSGVTLQGKLGLKDSVANVLTMTIASSLDREKLRFNVLSACTPPSASQCRIDIEGQWRYQEDEAVPGTLSLSGTIQNLTWPVNDMPVLHLRQGVFQYDSGTLHTAIKFNDLNLEPTGTRLTEVVLQTSSKDAERINLSGRVATSGGSLLLTGKLTKLIQGFDIEQLLLKGRNFTLIKKSNTQIVISPTLAFSRNVDKIQTSGTIRVPAANIQLQDINETYYKLAMMFSHLPQANIAVGSFKKHLALEFGKAVWLQGYGLNANVTGSLTIENHSNQEFIANGSLAVLRGNYTNHSGKFLLAGGQLTFNNKRLDNPDMELNVVSNQQNHSSPTIIIKGPLQALQTVHFGGTAIERSQPKVGRIALND